MKTFNKILYFILLVVVAVSCTRDYDAPPFNRPTSGGKANLTIAGLKKRYASTQSNSPVLIDVDYVINAYVTGNDESGNIYKQVYIQDETGAINIGIDQNSMYTSLHVGQELFINLHGLSIVNYGGELQIGYTGTNANRIPWEVFKEKMSLEDWPDATNATPTTVPISQLTPEMANTLIRLDNVYFANGGKNNFTTNDATTNEALKDGSGNSVDVRTSSYANFASQKLPSGGGSVVGILGRFNGSWQLIVRSMDDIINFGGDIPTDPDPEPSDEVIFYETFGTGTYPSGNRPKIADFTGFDMKAPVVFSDATGNADIRSISGDNGAHVWLPANRDTKLTITGINTSGKSDLVLSYQVAANLYDADATGNLNALTVTCNGTVLPVPSTPVSNANGDNAKFYTFSIKENIPAASNLTIEFAVSVADNAIGLRLDNIKIAVESTIVLP